MNITHSEKGIIIEFSHPRKILSSAIYNGGFFTSNTIVNVHTTDSQILDNSPESIISDFLEKNEKEKNAVGLLTSAKIKYAQFIYIQESDLKVLAVVTAGTSNAINITERTHTIYSGKSASFPGTINIIIITSAFLMDECMVSTVITSTEAKTQALFDLRIKSICSNNQATGTGTDAVVIVSGEGEKIKYAGGHTLFGQMIGEAVYKGVTYSLNKQVTDHPSEEILKNFDN